MLASLTLNPLRGLLAALAPLALLVALTLPHDAHAIVFIGNPGTITVVMPDGDEGPVTFESVVFATCDGATDTLTDVDGDVVTGIDYSSTLSDICAMTIEPAGGEIRIAGVNSSGPFEIAIDESELDVEAADLPKTLAYTVISGTVTASPVLYAE